MEASSAINTPHPDTPADDAEDFFGGSEAEGAEQAPTADVSAPETPEAPDVEPGEPAPATGAVEPPTASSAATAEADARQRGAVDREYIVFRKLALTKESLKALLAEIESGTTGKIRHAFFELHRPIARNDKQAVAETYKHHHAVLGDESDVAAVSARSFKERHIAPEEIPAERKLRIT